MKQRLGSSSLSALKLKSFSSLVKWWARIIHVTWKVTCLHGIFTGCVWMHAHIPENHWQCECSKSDDPGTNAGTHYPCIFRNLCVKGALVDLFFCLVQGVSGSWDLFVVGVDWMALHNDPILPKALNHDHHLSPLILSTESCYLHM